MNCPRCYGSGEYVEHREVIPCRLCSGVGLASECDNCGAPASLADGGGRFCSLPCRDAYSLR